MPRDTKFSVSWLDNKDRNEDVVKTWCSASPKNEFSAMCFVCRKEFSVSNMGFLALLSHADSVKHKNNMKCMKKQSFFICQNKSGSSSGETQTSKVMLLSSQSGSKWIPTTDADKILKAEASLILSAIKNNYSFSSLGDFSELFASIFEDSTIAKNVKLSEKKIRYVINFGLAPYFRSHLFRDISNSFYVLHFDETTTNQVKKQFDLHISYWSQSTEKVITSYCHSEFLGHAEAKVIVEIILKFISTNSLDSGKLLQCSMDGPAVNLCAMKMLNAKLNKESVFSLIDFCTCVLHTMHNALKYGIGQLNFDVDNFATDIYHWFKLSAARREDFHNVQVSSLTESAANHVFLRHVNSRWLTLGPICDRIIEQYSALSEYFLKFLPKQSTFKSNERYCRIVSILKDPKTLSYLHFISYFVATFMPYVKLFQREDPVIHLMFSKLNELIQTVMCKFIKLDIIKQNDNGLMREGLSLSQINFNSGENWLKLKKMDVGSAAKKLLDDNSQNSKDVLLVIRSCYLVTAKYLMEKLPFSNPLLKDIQCLHPYFQKEEISKSAVDRLCKHMWKVVKTDAMCDKINSEWILYMCQDFTKSREKYDTDHDICKYWADVSKIKDTTGMQKFKSLFILVKACLTLSHGNAGPERGFSANNLIVTKDRASLSEKCIESLRVCKDAIRSYKNSVLNLPITKEMLSAIKKSHAEYASFIEQEKEKAKQNEMKRKIDEETTAAEVAKKQKKGKTEEKLKELIQEEKELLESQAAAQKILNDSSEKLNIGVKMNNMSDIKYAQILLSTGNEELNKITQQLRITHEAISACQNSIKKMQ